MHHWRALHAPCQRSTAAFLSRPLTGRFCSRTRATTRTAVLRLEHQSTHRSGDSPSSPSSEDGAAIWGETTKRIWSVLQQSLSVTELSLAPAAVYLVTCESVRTNYVLTIVRQTGTYSKLILAWDWPSMLLGVIFACCFFKELASAHAWLHFGRRCTSGRFRWIFQQLPIWWFRAFARRRLDCRTFQFCSRMTMMALFADSMQARHI